MKKTTFLLLALLVAAPAFAQPFGDYGGYLQQRWNELGGEAATQAVRERTGVFREDQMPWGSDDQRAEHLAAEFKAVQCPIFVRIAGELHHAHGHRDVGLGRKPGGNNCQTAAGPIASDIIVLRALDGSGAFEWVDAFQSMGGPGARPQWQPIEPNTDRSWLEPPVPDADMAIPITPNGAIDESLGTITSGTISGDTVSVIETDWISKTDVLIEAVKELRDQVEALRGQLRELQARPFPEYSASLPLRLGTVTLRPK